MADNRKRAILLSSLILCGIISAAAFLWLGGFTYPDTAGHWRIVAYTLKGYNPYTLIGADTIEPAIGAIPGGFTTVPWALVFGTLFYAGYAPLWFAEIYILFLHAGTAVVLLYLLGKEYKEKRLLITMALALFTSFSFLYSVHYGNYGAVISMILACAIILTDRNTVIAGLLMGVALLKPQISAPFCLIWALQGKWKHLAIAAAFTASGWAASSIVTSTNPITLLAAMFETGTASSYQYLGLLSPLKYYGVDPVTILAINATIGIGVIIVIIGLAICTILKMNKEEY